MLAARICAEERDVNQRLQAFGVTREELIRIVREVVAARADAIEDDPLGTSGQFAYIYGTRHLRGVFRPKKWQKRRKENVESVKHPEKDLEIVYQNVDLAASKEHSPRAISGKGSGADRIIDSAQGCLFTDEELERLTPAIMREINSGVWFFCVSVDGDDVRAELSLPFSIEDQNFKGFFERIFIVSGGEWSSLKIVPNDKGDAVEFEPKVTRK